MTRWFTWTRTLLLVSYGKYFFSRWIPLLLWAGQIFIFSSHSNPADVLPRFLIRFLWTTLILKQRLFMISGVVAHFVNFGVLAILLTRAIIWKSAIKFEKLLIVFLISFAYGVSDEIHQCFVPMRTHQVRDILMNGLGAAAGIALFSCITNKKHNRARNEQLLL